MNEYRMFIYDPPTVFAARVNMPGSIEYPTEEIPYDGVTIGSHSAVKKDMTILFGSEAGRDDLGRYRVVSITDAMVYIGSTPNGVGDGQVDLVDNAHITVLDDYRVWAKIPFYSKESKLWYKDGLNIAAGDNVLYPPPVANGGGPVVGTINGSGYYEVIMSGESSFAHDTASSGLQPVTTYSWNVADGSIVSGSATTEDITVQFPPGFRWVHLTVTKNYGPATTSHICHIPVFVRDPDDDDSTANFQILSHQHSRDGITLSVRLTRDYPRNNYIDGTMVLVWRGEASSQTNRSNILFYGWITGETLNTAGGEKGTIRDTVITMVDIMGRLKVLPAFSQIQTYSTTPTKWEETRCPNIIYYLWYLLHWHSTALDLGDFLYVSPYNLSVSEFKQLGSDAGDLYSQVNGMANAITPDCSFNVSRLGQMCITADPIITPVGDRNPWFVTPQDTIGDSRVISINYTYSPYPKIQKLTTAAVLGDKDAFLTAFVRVPTKGRGHGVQVLDTTNRYAVGLGTLQESEGNRYARLNSPFSLITLEVVFDEETRLWEPAFHQWIRMEISNEFMSHMQTSLESHFEENTLLHQLSFNYSYEPTGTIVTITATLEVETSGPPAEEYDPANPDA